jgi:hypothetical protein
LDDADQRLSKLVAYRLRRQVLAAFGLGLASSSLHRAHLVRAPILALLGNILPLHARHTGDGSGVFVDLVLVHRRLIRRAELPRCAQDVERFEPSVRLTRAPGVVVTDDVDGGADGEEGSDRVATPAAL